MFAVLHSYIPNGISVRRALGSIQKVVCSIPAFIGQVFQLATISDIER